MSNLESRADAVKDFAFEEGIMAAQVPEPRRFIRKTQLGPGEYRKNFRQIDADVIAAVTSREADGVTPLMSKIYLRLVNAPARNWEREGVLRFEAELRDGAHVKAWDALCEVIGVASATASKALRWMHEQGIVGYFAGKNGVGIRVFLNRASSSIGSRATGKKILEFPPASSLESRASTNEAAFSDSYADLESLEKDLNPRAPKNGADTRQVVKTSPEPRPVAWTPAGQEAGTAVGGVPTSVAVPVGEIVCRLKAELEPCVRDAAARAAAQSASREMEHTREWFETKALPKAVRVAQRETYNLLRRQRRPEDHDVRGSAGLEVGLAVGGREATARPLTPEEIREAAEVCVALLEAQGKPIEVTLSEISSEGGGWLLPDDAPRVRELAGALALGGKSPRRGAGD